MNKKNMYKNLYNILYMINKKKNTNTIYLHELSSLYKNIGYIIITSWSHLTVLLFLRFINRVILNFEIKLFQSEFACVRNII